MRLVAAIASVVGIDPVDVLAKASEWKGTMKLNPSTMTDDRLLVTHRHLRGWLTAARRGLGLDAALPAPMASDDPRVVEVWEAILAGLRVVVPEHRKVWLIPIVPLRIEGEDLYVLSPSRDHAVASRSLFAAHQGVVLEVLNRFKIQRLVVTELGRTHA